MRFDDLIMDAIEMDHRYQWVKVIVKFLRKKLSFSLSKSLWNSTYIGEEFFFSHYWLVSLEPNIDLLFIATRLFSSNNEGQIVFKCQSLLVVSLSFLKRKIKINDGNTLLIFIHIGSYTLKETYDSFVFFIYFFQRYQ